MAAVANNPSFAKKVGVPQSVGKDFARADKAKGFSTQAKINRPNTAHGKLDMPFHSVTKKAKGGAIMKKLFGGKESYKEELGEAKAVKSGRISPKQFVKGEKSEGHGKEEKGLMGMAKKIKSGKMAPSQYAKMEAKETYARGGGIESRGKTKGTIIKMARGGGIEVRGKTKGRMI